MNDVAKHGNVVGHGVLPMPDPAPVLPDVHALVKLPFQLGSPTVFDGDDYSPVNPSFDIEGAAARVVTEYDRNGDGAIDLGSGGRISDALLRETSRFQRTGTSSIEDLARFADEHGNDDGSATVAEIADVIRRFDQGNEGDGRLSAQERETFLEVFGEDRSPLRVPTLHPRPIFPRPFEPPFHHRHPSDVGDMLIGNHPPFDKVRAGGD